MISLTSLIFLLSCTHSTNSTRGTKGTKGVHLAAGSHASVSRTNNGQGPAIDNDEYNDTFIYDDDGEGMYRVDVPLS